MHVSQWFNLDPLAVLMVVLMVTVSSCVGMFAFRYMRYDSQRHRYFKHLISVAGFSLIWVTADHALLFFLAFCLSHVSLASMMIHKPLWKQAKASGWRAAKQSLFSASALGAFLILMYLMTGQTSISLMVQHSFTAPQALILLFLVIAAMSQSALWPFHRWLLSSLNAPTMVSALMHAGLINGGGYLLVRFSPLVIQSPLTLNLLFILGLVTAVIGTLWKLMQTDVKRMLACSTVGQMGFMIMQCGLGLFPAAVAHLCFHGFFKAYLFLNHANIALETKTQRMNSHGWLAIGVALLAGLLGSYSFSFVLQDPWMPFDTRLILQVVAGVYCAHIALVSVQKISLTTLVPIAVSPLVGAMYGAVIWAIERVLLPMNVLHPQPMSGVYLMGVVGLVSTWIGFIKLQNNTMRPAWWPRLYVYLLNASWPYSDTVTSKHTAYQSK